MNILVKFPIRLRREKFFKTLELYLKIATDRKKLHVLVSMDEDDKEMNTPDVQKRLGAWGVEYYYGQNKTKIQACNADIERTSYDWDILILASDDMIPVAIGWDNIIRDKMKQHYPDLDGVLHFHDGHQKDRINTLSIIGRKYYERFGYIYNPVYRTMYCDAEFTDISRLLNKETYFAETIIEHRHPYSGAIEMDDLYKRNNVLDFDRDIYLKRKANKFYLKSVIIIQPGRVGDILICLPIAKHFSDLNYIVYWFCPKEYHDIFRNIDYVKPTETRIPADKVIDLSFGFGGQPEQWWMQNMHNFESFIAAKYYLAELPLWKRRTLKWNHNEQKETELYNLLVKNRIYTLVHSESHTGKYLHIENAIQFRPIEGYNVFDWYKVISQAKDIHCIDSALSNFIEVVPEFKNKKKTIYTEVRESNYFLRSIFVNNWNINRGVSEPINDMIAIVIPVYNRPELLKKTLQSLRPCLTENVWLFLADDGSFNTEVPAICNDFIFSINGRGTYLRNKNRGVSKNMFEVLEMCKPYKTIITLDSDFIVKPDFITRLHALLKTEGNEDTIITGFNATSHPIIMKYPSAFAAKKTIGGGNLCFTWAAYIKHVRNTLINDMWDWNLCHSIARHGGRLLCTLPSVAQHIGTESTLGHPRADIAIDY